MRQNVTDYHFPDRSIYDFSNFPGRSFIAPKLTTKNGFYENDPIQMIRLRLKTEANAFVPAINGEETFLLTFFGRRSNHGEIFTQPWRRIEKEIVACRPASPIVTVYIS